MIINCILSFYRFLLLYKHSHRVRAHIRWPPVGRRTEFARVRLSRHVTQLGFEPPIVVPRCRVYSLAQTFGCPHLLFIMFWVSFRFVLFVLNFLPIVLCVLVS